MIFKPPTKTLFFKGIGSHYQVPENIHIHPYEQSLEILRGRHNKFEKKAWSETGVSGGEGVSNQKTFHR